AIAGPAPDTCSIAGFRSNAIGGFWPSEWRVFSLASSIRSELPRPDGGGWLPAASCEKSGWPAYRVSSRGDGRSGASFCTAPLADLAEKAGSSKGGNVSAGCGSSSVVVSTFSGGSFSPTRREVSTGSSSECLFSAMAASFSSEKNGRGPQLFRSLGTGSCRRSNASHDGRGKVSAVGSGTMIDRDGLCSGNETAHRSSQGGPA